MWEELGVDFLAFTGHKMLGPTGIGGLWGRPNCSTSCRRSSAAARWSRSAPWASPPTSAARQVRGRHHADRAGGGLGAAVDYLYALGMMIVPAHEESMTEYALERLAEVAGVRIIGPRPRRTAAPPYLRGPASTRTTPARCSTSRDRCPGRSALRAAGLPVRYGCRRPPECRLPVYTTKAEIDALVEGL